MTLDIISDIHLDFYVRFNQKGIETFTKKLINTKTNKNFDVLIIAGDIGHYNDDNIYFLELISKFYKKVFVTWGNHDLYLLESQREKYYYNSFNRLNELKEMIKEIDNVVFLDGEKIEYEGITFWGSGLWYKVRGFRHWIDYMNDSRFIHDENDFFNVIALFKKEYEKIKHLDKADVIISHIPPVDFDIWRDIIDTYYFVPYGEEIIERIKPKMWIFGHIHTKRDKNFNGCRLICNPLGYPDENRDFKIESVEI